jgi:xyloglucan fucosyltransferase
MQLFPVVAFCAFIFICAFEVNAHENNQTGNFTRNYHCAHQHDFRFAQNPPIENRHLRAALKRYEQLHANATNDPNYLEYLANPVTKITHRFLHLELTASGLGNRLNTVLSGFLVALLTDRVLLISGDYDYDHYLCQPFPNSDWIFPRHLDMKLLAGGPKFRTTRDNFWNLIHDNVQNIDSYQIISYIEGEQYFIPFLFLNTAYLPKLNKWFPDRNVATVLFRYLLHPRDMVWNEVVKTMSMKQGGDLSIGLQVRHNGGLRDRLSCLHDTIPYQTHIFVSSMFNQVPELNRHYPTVNVTQRFSEGSENWKANDLHQHMTSYHDIWMLALTDETVLSPKSTFGYMAQALKGRPCLTTPARAEMDATHEGINGVNTTNCIYVNSHEPCFDLFHLKQWTGGKYGVTPEQLTETVMECEDNNLQHELRHNPMRLRVLGSGRR